MSESHKAPETSALGTLIADLLARRGQYPTTLVTNAVDPLTGNSAFSKPHAYELVNERRRAFLLPDKYRALAAHFDRSEWEFITATAKDLEIAPLNAGEFGSSLPNWVDQLPFSVKANLREQITLWGRAHGLTD